MKVLVIGGCGFIGSHIVDHLSASGHLVRVFDRCAERFRRQLKDVDYVFGDINDRTMTLEALADIDTVMHLAGTTFPGTANLDPQADIRDNLLSTLSLLDSMVQVRVSRLVYLSSGGTVYGVPDQIPTPETHPLRPINSYGIVKATAESYIGLFHREKAISPIIIRPSNPFGPRQGHTGVQGVVTTFLTQLQRKEPIEIWGDGRVVRDYLYVEDLARLCVTAAASDKAGAFNVGSGQGRSLNEVIAQIQDVTGRVFQPIYRPGRTVDVSCSTLDISRVRKEFLWEPEIDFTEGIARTWKWVCSTA